MLNAHERHQLRIIEHSLEADDPDLARTFTDWHQTARRRRRFAAASVLLAVLATAVSVLAVVTTIFPLLFLAALVGIAAICLTCTQETR
jgi:hypothetical protein